MVNRQNAPLGSRVFTTALATLLALFFFSAPARCQEKSFLWRVSSSDGNNSIFLAGSIHFLKREHYPLKKPLEAAFDGAKRLVLEIDLQSSSAEKAQSLTLAKGVYRDSTTLQQNIAAETFSLAEKRAADLGLDLRMFNPLKPWVVALTLTAVKLQKLGFDPNYGVDQYFAGRARDAGKPIAGLETLEFQIGLLDQMPKAAQEAMLRQTLQDFDRMDKHIEEIVQSWAKGDARAVEEQLLAGAKEFPDLHQKLYFERNRRWLPQIETLIEQGGNTMVVVGAAHLVGNEGVIELLKQKGYKVEQQ